MLFFVGLFVFLGIANHCAEVVFVVADALCGYGVYEGGVVQKVLFHVF